MDFHLKMEIITQIINMRYNILYTCSDKDGYLILTVRRPHSKYLIDLINSIDEYVGGFGNYKGVSFYLSPKSSKSDMLDFKTNMVYNDYIKKQDSSI